MNHSLQLGGLEENQHREMTRCESFIPGYIKSVHLLISRGNLTLTERLAIVLFASIPTFKFTVLHCFSW